MSAYGQAIGRIIYAVLSTDTDISGLGITADQIQPAVIYDKAITKGIYYEVNAVNNVNTKTTQAADLSVVDFQVEVFADTYETGKSIAIEVQKALDKLAAGSYGLAGSLKIDGCTMIDATDTVDKSNNLYYFSLGFSARIVPT